VLLLNTRVYVPRSHGSLHITIKPEAKNKFRAATMMTYILSFFATQSGRFLHHVALVSFPLCTLSRTLRW